MHSAYFFIFLLFTTTLAISNHRYLEDSEDEDSGIIQMAQVSTNMQTQTIEQFNQLGSTNPLGKMVLDMAELNMKVIKYCLIISGFRSCRHPH
jgi:hypothetical protein